MKDLSRLRLQLRIAELEEENRQLREALTPTIRLPLEWSLTPQETDLLLTIYGSSTVVRFEALAVSLARKTEPLSDMHIAVLVSKVRRKLAARGIGIRITNRWGVGYFLDGQSRAVIADALSLRPNLKAAA